MLSQGGLAYNWFSIFFCFIFFILCSSFFVGVVLPTFIGVLPSFMLVFKSLPHFGKKMDEANFHL